MEIIRRDLTITGGTITIEQIMLTQGNLPDIGRQRSGALAGDDRLGLTIREGLDHERSYNAECCASSGFEGMDDGCFDSVPEQHGC